MDKWVTNCPILHPQQAKCHPPLRPLDPPRQLYELRRKPEHGHIGLIERASDRRRAVDSVPGLIVANWVVGKLR